MQALHGAQRRAVPAVDAEAEDDDGQQHEAGERAEAEDDGGAAVCSRHRIRARRSNRRLAGRYTRSVAGAISGRLNGRANPSGIIGQSTSTRAKKR